MSKLNLFLSHKDNKCIETFDFLKKFEDHEKYVNILSIHDNKEFVRQSGITKVPSIIENNDIIVGKKQCCLKLQSYIISKKNPEKINPSSLNPLPPPQNTFKPVTEDSGNFGNINTPPPMFTNITEPNNTDNNSEDLAAKIARYNQPL